MNYALLDYGLRSRPDLKHVCGRYELRADGKLTSLDLFVAPGEPKLLRAEVERELQRQPEPSAETGTVQARRPDVTLVVESTAHFAWPQHCRKELSASAHSVLIATRVL